MNKTCQNCKNQFLIDADNQAFCDKIKVPYPTWCPACRMTRRLIAQNTWNVNFVECVKCKTKTMSMYRSDANLKFYCQKCWWADDWDGTEYGVEYDPKRPFFEQWKELQLKTPQVVLDSAYLTIFNSEYTNYTAYSKNCFMVFWADYCEDVYHSSILNNIKDSSDLLHSFNCELSYESVGLGDCNKTYFSDTCVNCVDVWFSRNCYGCMNCVGCVNLRGQSYMIFNQKYSREKYFEKLKEMRLDTRVGIGKIKKQAEEFCDKFPVRENTGSTLNYNCDGEYIFRSKNTKDSYMCTDSQDVRFCQFLSVESTKDSYDYSGWGANSSLMYESSISGDGCNNVKFTFHGYPDIYNVEYSMWCVGGKNNFGCANLKRKQYAILNKVYDKETYEKLVAQIKQDMMDNPYIDNKGRVYKYGEFFPPEFSLFPYNDSNAMKFLPKTKEQALIEGYTWKDRMENTYTPTLLGKDLPQTIKEVTEDITNEIISCVECDRSYKIANGEYTILTKLNLPIPDTCPKCREVKRFAKINKPVFRDAQCAKCNIQIKTAHPTDRIVYCAKCYQQELV